MSTVQRTSGYNYQDYVPVEGITCPICDIACTSLQALNLHLDEAHTEEDSKGALLSWFRNAQKKVQTTLASNARSPTGSSSSSYSAERSLKQLVDPVFMSSFQNLTLNGVGGPAFFASDSEGDFITRSHWQAESGNDVCSLPGCGKPLGRIGAARQHCRQCGKIFCEAHMQYEIKLDRHARHDPVNGVWCRVCFGCFVSRPDYMSVSGVTRSWTDTFLKKRAKTIDRVHLESNRLERRLEKLARIHHSTDIGSSRDTPRSGSSSSLGALSLERTDSTSSKDSGSVMSSKSARVSNGNSILSMKLKYRDGEQTVTKWQDDKNVTNCPLCSTKFTLTNRKHHCRLCGRVVCGQSRCSRMIPLFLDMSSNQFDEEPVGDTRACAECQRSVFRRKTMHEEASKPLPIIQLYQQLSITRQNIEKQLPLFHDMIVLLEKDKISRQSQANIQKAAQIRKSLLDSFALYDTLAKTIKSLPVRSPSVRRLQGNICTAANLYLQQNMLPLQMLPRILKPEKKKQLNGASSKPQKEDLRLQLEAFQEQEMLLQGYIQDAQRNRKYDDVKTLQRSLEEVRVEIERIKANLA